MKRVLLLHLLANAFVFVFFYYGGLAGITLLTYYECRNSESPISCLRDNLYITLYRLYRAMDKEEEGREVILSRCRTYPSPMCREIEKVKGWI